MHVVVAGGGVAGLTAARRLAEAGADVELLEADERVGGRVGSRTVDGFTLDRGFQVLFAAYPAARRELDLEALDLRAFSAGATIARPNRRSTLADPARDRRALVPSLLNRDVTTGDKLRLFRLARELRSRDPGTLLDGEDSTIRSYLKDRGFSTAFVERFAEPFFGGITLDRSLSTSSRVLEYAVAMLARGSATVPASGMGAIPTQLREAAEAAGATVRTGETVTGLDGDADGSPTVVAGNERVFPEAAVVATDPVTAGELTGVDIPAEGRGCVTVHCSIPDHQHLDTGTRILLNADDDRPNTVAPVSAAAPERAPEGRELLSATFLGEPEADDARLGEEVRDALTAWYPENSFGDLEVVTVDRVPFAQFAQPPGFREDLPSVDAPVGAVYLAGEYTLWSSIQGALESGRRAAEAVLSDLE